MRASTPQLPVFREEDWTREELLDIDPRPEMLCFRGQTLAIMRHFFELSCQVGRLPSLLGREFFRAKVSHHAIPSFEEQAVFARDVELCLARLSDEHSEMITLVGLYDFSHDEIAEMLRRSKAWVHQHVALALDALSEIFLQAGVLSEGRPDRRQCQVTNRSIPADIVAAGRKRPCASVASPDSEAQAHPPGPEAGVC